MRWLKRLTVSITSLLVFVYFDGIQHGLALYHSDGNQSHFDARTFTPQNNCNGIRPCTTGPIKVLSFNVLCRACRDPLYKTWEQRTHYTQLLLQRYEADLLGIQELMDAEDGQTLLQMIGGEQAFGIVSYAMGDWFYPDSALFYRKARFQLLGSGQLWLSPKPTVPLAKGWQALSVPRYANWAYLQEKNSGFRFLFINTHFDNNRPNKEAAARLFAKEFGSLKQDIPMIITGDFNTPRNTQRFVSLQGLTGGKPVFLPVEDLAATTTVVTGEIGNAGRIQEATPALINRLIDHILIAGPAHTAVGRWILDRSTFGDEQSGISDHPLVYSEITLSLD